MLVCIRDRRFEINVEPARVIVREVNLDGLTLKVVTRDRDTGAPDDAEMFGGISYAAVHAISGERLGTLRAMIGIGVFREEDMESFFVPDDLEAARKEAMMGVPLAAPYPQKEKMHA